MEYKEKENSNNDFYLYMVFGLSHRIENSKDFVT